MAVGSEVPADGEDLDMGRMGLCLVLASIWGGAVAMAEELPDFDRMWDYAKPEETEKRFRVLLPAAEASGDAEYVLQLLTQIARTLGLQGKFDEAHAVLDEVEQELGDETPVAHVRALLERGRTFNSSKQKEKARAHFLEAWELARKTKQDHLALDAAHMMGIVEPKEERLAWSLKALEIAERSEDRRCKGWLGALYNNIGWTLFDLGRLQEALEIHEKGLAWREEVGQPKPTLIARWAVARVTRALGRTEEALSMQKALLASWAALGEESGFVHEELAECLLALGREDEAKPHFVKAWALLQDVGWLRDGEPERYARLREKAGAAASD